MLGKTNDSSSLFPGSLTEGETIVSNCSPTSLEFVKLEFVTEGCNAAIHVAIKKYINIFMAVEYADKIRRVLQVTLDTFLPFDLSCV